MADAGCVDVFFGIESGSPNMQRNIKKYLQVDQVLPRVKEAVGLGMSTTCSFICGFPDETKEDLELSMDMIFSLIREQGSRVSVQMHLLAPFIGTDVYDKYKADMKMDSYLSDQTGQELDWDDLEIIRELPSVFSNFYYVPTIHYERKLLYGLDTFVYLVLLRYQSSFVLLWNAGFSSLDLYSFWQRECLGQMPASRLAAVVSQPEKVWRAARATIEHFAGKSSTTIVARELMKYEDSIATQQLTNIRSGVTGRGAP